MLEDFRLKSAVTIVEPDGADSESAGIRYMSHYVATPSPSCGPRKRREAYAPRIYGPV